jgi:bla regulator protein BlaR1
MNAVWELVDHPLARRTGWVLLHSIWQGCLVGMAFGMLRHALRRQSADIRYLAGCAALVLLLAAPVVTVIAGWTPSIEIPRSFRTVAVAANAVVSALDASEGDASSGGNSTFWFARRLIEFLGRLTPVLTCLWLLGVIFCSCRLTRSWWWARRLRGQRDGTDTGPTGSYSGP